MISCLVCALVLPAAMTRLKNKSSFFIVMINVSFFAVFTTDVMINLQSFANFNLQPPVIQPARQYALQLWDITHDRVWYDKPPQITAYIGRGPT